MSSVNISVVGAGSAVFSMRLVSDICKSPGLSGSHITLMDKDEERLHTVSVLARKLASELKFPLEFSTTTNLTEAVEGADFVINTALVGGHAFLDEMRKIGEKHGYYRGIDSQEFNMVSDYYTLTNWNQLGFMLQLARMIEASSPRTWLLIAANPVFEGTTLLTRQTCARVVGFCHGHMLVDNICKTIGFDIERVDWQIAGVNHGVWLNKFRLNGHSAYNKILEGFSEPDSFKPTNPFDDTFSPAAKTMLDFYGLMPVGDTARNSTWAFHYDEETKKKWYGEPWGGVDSPEGWKWYTDMLASVVKMLKELALLLEADSATSLKQVYSHAYSSLPGGLREDARKFFDPDALSGEQHIPFINAIVNDEATRLVVNTPNTGIIPQLPEDIAVEVPALVDSDGIHPEEIDPPLPDRIVKWYLLPRIMRMEWALEAFLKKDPSLIVEILLRDPRTRSYEQAVSVVKEIFTVTEE